MKLIDNMLCNISRLISKNWFKKEPKKYCEITYEKSGCVNCEFYPKFQWDVNKKECSERK